MSSRNPGFSKNFVFEGLNGRARQDYAGAAGRLGLPPPAGSFLPVQKGTKDTLRGRPPVRLRPALRALLTGGPPPENPLIAGDQFTKRSP